MFGNLKTKSSHTSVFTNRPDATSHSRMAGANSSQTKGNEAERLVRCRHCGFICDLERDVLLHDGSYAGLGISYGAQLSAGTSVGDRRTPAAGSVATSVDTYYTRNVSAGCPNCGSYLYHPGVKIQQTPTD